MNINFNNLVENAYVLSVYPKRIALMQKLFAYENLPMPKTFNGVKDRGIYATPCDHGYALMIQYAIDNDLPYIWIFDDDAYPCKNVRKLIEEYYLNDIPDDCDYLQFSWSRNRNSHDLKFNRILDLCNCSCSYILFKNAYQKALDCLQGKYGDRFKFGDKMSLNMNSYVTDIPLFIQYNLESSKGFSASNVGYDITHDDYLPKYFNVHFNEIDQIINQKPNIDLNNNAY